MGGVLFQHSVQPETGTAEILSTLVQTCQSRGQSPDAYWGDQKNSVQLRSNPVPPQKKENTEKNEKRAALMRAQGRRWLRLVHKLRRPTASRAHAKKELRRSQNQGKGTAMSMRQTSKPLLPPGGAASRYHAKAQSSYREPLFYCIGANISFLESLFHSYIRQETGRR